MKRSACRFNAPRFAINDSPSVLVSHTPGSAFCVCVRACARVRLCVFLISSDRSRPTEQLTVAALLCAPLRSAVGRSRGRGARRTNRRPERERRAGKQLCPAKRLSNEKMKATKRSPSFSSLLFSVGFFLLPRDCLYLLSNRAHCSLTAG